MQDCHSRLQGCCHAMLDRISSLFDMKAVLKLRNQPEDILQIVVTSCQNIFVNELKLDSTITKNEALKENMWMMVICIELKIPLFLVDKPGSSKSLAKTMVGDIMQAQNSYSKLFRDQKKRPQSTDFWCYT